MDENIVDVDAEGAGPGRRTVIKGAAVALAGVWAVPVVSSFTSPAYAAGSVGNPNPECQGSSCGAFTQCNTTGPNCICTTTSTGGGFCIDGTTFCDAGSGACGPGGACQPGEVCLVNTCCAGPVCIPISANSTCPADTGGAAVTTTARVKGGPGTIGG